MINTNIIFDLDGTLVDSSRDIIHYLKKAYETLPQYYGTSVKKSHLGSPLNEIITKITPEITSSARSIVYKTFRNSYDNSPLTLTKPYPGAIELLQTLKFKKTKLFLATNKPSPQAIKTLNVTHINFFDNIATSTDFPSKTAMIEHHLSCGLDPSTTIMIGDDATDIMAAHANKISSIAILNGYGNTKKLIRSKPLYTIKDIDQLNRGNGYDI